MEQFIFFRHRHTKENNELRKAFETKGEVNKYTLNKLRESVPFDFTEKNINKTRRKFNTFLQANYGVNFLEAYMLDGEKVVAHQLYMFDQFNLCGIMDMETRPEYRRRGIAESLLNDCEKILFEQIQVNEINSTATQYSRNMFKKRGYHLQLLTKPQLIKSPLNPSNVEVKLTRERYNTIKASRVDVKTSEK